MSDRRVQPKEIYGQYRVPPSDVLVDLKVGQPSPNMLPKDMIRDAAYDRFNEEEDNLVLQYGCIPGYEGYRKSLAEYLASKYQHNVDFNWLFSCNGVTGGLQAVCTFMCRENDIVLVEDPTYFLALNIFKEFRLKIVPVPTDSEGMCIESLKDILENKLDRPPRMLYTIPMFNNPSGVSMSMPRRAALVKLARKHKFMVVADEVYQFLSFPSKHLTPQPMAHLDLPEMRPSRDSEPCVLSIGSFSKTLAPALRLGWIYGDPKLWQCIEKSAVCDSGGSFNPFASAIVHQIIKTGKADVHLERVRCELEDRCQGLLSACDRFLPEGVEISRPEGGYFVLLKMPNKELRSDELNMMCRESYKVGILPGTTFGGEKYCNYIRLSFSYYNREDIELGVERLGRGIIDYAAKKGIKLEPKSGSSSTTHSTSPVK